MTPTRPCGHGDPCEDPDSNGILVRVAGPGATFPFNKDRKRATHVDLDRTGQWSERTALHLTSASCDASASAVCIKSVKQSTPPGLRIREASFMALCCSMLACKKESCDRTVSTLELGSWVSKNDLSPVARTRLGYG